MIDEKAYREYLAQRKGSNKTNYYLVSQKEIERIQKDFGAKKPKLLLHCCCAVCASWPIVFLQPYFDLTLFFNNSNIFPESEYTRRKEELIRYVKETFPDISIIDTPYAHETYMKPLVPYKDEPEGWVRCFLCYEIRMEEAYCYAEEYGFDFFTTVMSISRQKDSQKINEIGKKLEEKHPTVRYFYSDFKKGNGQVYQKDLVEQHHLYRQDYCGCEYSYAARHPKEG